MTKILGMTGKIADKTKNRGVIVLAHKHEGDRGEAERVADHEEHEAGEREPGEVGVRAVRLQVEEGAHRGRGERHDEAGGDQEQLAAGLVDQEDGDWKGDICEERFGDGGELASVVTI